MNASTTGDRATRPPSGRRGSPRLEWSGAAQIGLVLIVVGGVLLVDNLGWLDAGAIFREWWPALVILVGISWFVGGSRGMGTAAILIGALLLANAQDLVDVDIGSLVFPSLLVLLGATLLNASAKVRTARGADGRSPRFATIGSDPGLRGSGAGDRSWAAGDLAATAVFGDTRLVVSDGDVGLDRATVTALSVFGDVKVDVPAGWRVENHATAIFGDVGIPHDQPTYAEAPVVELHGLVLFGDAKVRYLDAPEGGR
jgi:hypothetical protein